jgi:hypothetical protein
MKSITYTQSLLLASALRILEEWLLLLMVGTLKSGTIVLLLGRRRMRGST